MNLKDSLNIKGKLTIVCYSLSGIMEYKAVVENDITKGGRDLVARLFNKNETNVSKVSKIRLGNSQADFDASHANLQGFQAGWETPIKSIEKVEADNSRVMLRLTGELTEQDCNGELREAGLFTDDDVMYNRVTFDTITKSDQFKLTMIWEITF